MEIAQGLAISVIAAAMLTALSHAIIPEPPPSGPVARPSGATPEPADSTPAVRRAMRGLVVVLPLAIVFLAAGSSPAYTVVMIKVASMGQQATAAHGKAMGTALMMSTLLGGLGAMVGWFVLGAWPSLLIFTLLIFLAGLIYGRRIFEGDDMHPSFQVFNYAFVTLIIILAPAVQDQVTGNDAGMAFWNRMLLFVLIGVYGTLALKIYDAFWPDRDPTSGSDPKIA